MQSGMFENVMTDVTGKIRLESGDPRWIQLFSSSNIPFMVNNSNTISRFGSRLVENNPITGNFVQLLEQTSARLHLVTSKKSAPSSQSIEQCCVSLYLTSLIVHHMVVSCTQKEVISCVGSASLL
jgi:hypothetical protein